MYVCMHVLVYIYMCKYISVCIYEYIYAGVCVYIYICIYIGEYVCVCICTHINICEGPYHLLRFGCRGCCFYKSESTESDWYNCVKLRAS